ncbi:MAG: glycosyltransferase [Clostridia bacterium]|nr:glycosyltransferase [Clostridia bacterium]
MKIALLIDGLGFGGAQRQMANLAVALKERGHEIFFLKYRADDFYKSILDEAEISPELITAKGGLARALVIRKRFNQIKPNVVISFMGSPNFYAALASIGPHKWRLIASERICNPSLFVGRKKKIIRMIVGNRADMIVCNSKSAEDLWKKYFPKTEKKLETVYNIVQPIHSECKPIKDGKTRFVVAARYEKEKNLERVIQAIADLSQEERQNIELHWYGKFNVGDENSDLLSACQEKIVSRGIDKIIFLHPATDKIHDRMAEADFVSLFSCMEGLPNGILEGMALKKPIVMTAVSDYMVLVDETNGFLCDPHSVSSITEALRSAINTTAEERVAMGEESYRKISSICSKKVIVDRWIELICR